MKGLELHDRIHGSLAFDLQQVLEALGFVVDDIDWTCADIDARGEGAIELTEMARLGRRLPGIELRRIARQVSVTSSGEFRGQNRVGLAVVIVRAHGGSMWEVFARPALLDRLRRHFADVRPTAREMD